MRPSLCDTCGHVREVRTPRSRFLLCGLSLTDAAYPKYPPQPVGRCSGYRPRGAADGETQRSAVVPLFRDPLFTFRFADDRIIPRFHLEGVPAGRGVQVFRIDPATGQPAGLLRSATVGEGGWVDLAEPIVVRAGEGFVARPDRGA